MTRAIGKSLAIAGLLISGMSAATAGNAVLLDEGFDGPTLPTDWVAANFSEHPAADAWFKPIDLDGRFAAQSGAAGSYAASSVFVGLPGADGNPSGRIDALLLTPLIAMDQTTTLSFYTRTLADNPYGESLKLGTLIGGSFHDVMTINPTLTVGAFPGAWTQYTYVLPAQGDGIVGQYYFEYLIPDASTAGNFIGLDSVRVVAAVPEPTNVALMLVGALALSAGRGTAALRRRLRPRFSVNV